MMESSSYEDSWMLEILPGSNSITHEDPQPVPILRAHAFKTGFTPHFQRSKQAVIRGQTALLVRERRWHLSFLMYQERAALCFLGNAFVNGEIALPSSKEGKIARG